MQSAPGVDAPRRTFGFSRTALGRAVPSVRVRSLPLVTGSDRLTSWLATFAVFGLALFLRVWRLDRPNSFQFDETYYAKDAWSTLKLGYPSNWVDGADAKIIGGDTGSHLMTKVPEMFVHPPVSKFLISAGEAMFGFDPLGWRIASAIIGALMVAVMVRLARRLTGSTMLGVVGGLLMCFDGLQLVLSRLALLDIFQAFFCLCAVACLVTDRDWGRARLFALAPTVPNPEDWGPRLFWRPWRLLAGVFFGLSVGTKWSTLYVMMAFGLLVWAWDAGARRRLGYDGAWFKAAVLDAIPAFLMLIVLPAVVYLASWIQWMFHARAYAGALADTQYTSYWGKWVNDHPTTLLGKVEYSLRALWHYHRAVWGFHTGTELTHATHTYQSNPGGWLVLNRPVVTDAQLGIKPGQQGCTAPLGSTCLREVILLGNPAVWWGGTIAAIYACFGWIARRDWRFGIVVVGLLATWLPWFRFDNRPIFSYYAIMCEPFVILGLVLLLGTILGPADGVSPRRRMVGGAVAGGYVVLVALTFAWFWPVWTDQLITTPHWLQRIWFQRWI